MRRIYWNQDYESLLHSVCVHCTVDGFDADSDELTMWNYLDLFFEKDGDGRVRLLETEKWWSFSVERQNSSSNSYQIVLNSDEKEQIWLRGDTAGTYKKILRCVNSQKRKLLLKAELESIKGLDTSELQFCNCKRQQVYNNHTIGSFFLMPKPISEKYKNASLNTARASSPFFDNFFMYIEYVKNYLDEEIIADSKFSSHGIEKCFRYTEQFWKMFKGEKGFESYIKCMCFEPFIEYIENEKELVTSPSTWDINMINRYFRALNRAIEERNFLLYLRAKKIN